MSELNQPSGKQCDKREKVFETEYEIGYAMWYPQMGGYCGKCIVIFDKKWVKKVDYGIGGCIDVYIWHDGDFPFHEGENPVELHHCDPQQFIDFGRDVKKINDKNKRNKIEEEKK